MTDTNIWQWWQDACDGRFGPMHSEPEYGYYRVRDEGGRGQWEPVAFWKHEGQWVAKRGAGGWDDAGNLPPNVKDVESLWTYACRNPIEHDVWERAMAGEGFEDEPPLPVLKTNGSNLANLDPLEAIRIEFIGEKEQVEEFLKKGVKSPEDANKLSIWKDRIMKLRGRAQVLFKAEKQPVVDEGRRIDEKYRALAHEKESEPSALVERIRLALEAHLKEQKRLEGIRQAAAAAEAARLQREAREAAEKAEEEARQANARAEDGNTAEVDEEALAASQIEAARLADAAEQAAKEAEARKISVGRTGAKTSLRTESVGVITDYYKAAKALVALDDRDILAELDRIAKAYAKKGETFDGMEIQQVEKVR